MITRTSALSVLDQVRRHHVHPPTGSWHAHDPPDVSDAPLTFKLMDYRDVREPFERIVSVGMFEHVGTPHYDAFFQKMARLLTDDGVALIHSIGRMDGPGSTSAWIRKYIFPGGYAPALSEVLPSIERAGLLVCDIEILRLHYAQTLKHWQTRFERERAGIAEYYDEQFCRMWEFYLVASEMAFRYDGLMVCQIQLAKRIDAVPLTRDYLIRPTETSTAAQGDPDQPAARRAYGKKADHLVLAQTLAGLDQEV